MIGRTTLGVALMLFLTRAGSGQNAAYQPDPNWRVPQQSVGKTNPLARNPQAVSGGKKLFLRNCAECHNEDGSGVIKKHAADLQLPIVQGQSDGSLFWKITNGNPDRGMPPFSKLPELQRWQLILFLRTLRPVETQ